VKSGGALAVEKSHAFEVIGHSLEKTCRDFDEDFTSKELENFEQRYLISYLGIHSFLQ
jgi:hypothetical protein